MNRSAPKKGRPRVPDFEAVVSHYRRHFQSRARAELDSFLDEPTLLSAIRRAALARTREGKRFSHQSRLTPANLAYAAEALVARADDLAAAPNFRELHQLIAAILEARDRLGDLYLYDTALRIGMKLGLSPGRVYLHTGARDGAKALGLTGKVIDVSDLPPAFRALAPYELEDVLCIYKRHFAGETDDLEEARVCWPEDADEEG